MRGFQQVADFRPQRLDLALQEEKLFRVGPGQVLLRRFDHRLRLALNVLQLFQALGEPVGDDFHFPERAQQFQFLLDGGYPGLQIFHGVVQPHLLQGPLQVQGQLGGA